MLPISPWSEEDLKQYQQLDECLSKLVTWSGSTGEMVKIYRSLVWYAQVRDKIKASMVSDVKLHQPKASEKVEE